MINIIKQGKQNVPLKKKTEVKIIYQIECEHCGCKFEFESEDVECIGCGVRQIKCPNCKNDNLYDIFTVKNRREEVEVDD